MKELKKSNIINKYSNFDIELINIILGYIFVTFNGIESIILQGNSIMPIYSAILRNCGKLLDDKMMYKISLNKNVNNNNNEHNNTDYNDIYSYKGY